MQKGQGALEYLLLIGGGLLITVIVIALLVGLGGSSGDEAIIATANAQCARYPLEECDQHTIETGKQTFKCYPFGINLCRARAGQPITSCGNPPGGWQQGGIYRLDSNISTSAPPGCLTIDKNNVTLNCMDNTIIHTNGFSIGIFIADADNVFISNCSIKLTQAPSDGIRMSNSHNSIIRNNLINVTSQAITVTNSSSKNAIYINNACPNTSSEIDDSSGQPQSSASGNNRCGTMVSDKCNGPSPVCECIPCS